MEFLKAPTAESLVSSSVPIAYKVRTLKDNKEVDVKTIIIEDEITTAN